MKTMNKSFWFLTVAIFSILMLPLLFQKGMFLDGVTYAAISNNMANGIGSFWNPLYTSTYEFWGHPPMAFGLESILFTIFGNEFYVEKLYSVLMSLLSAYGIVLCWKLFKPQSFSWIPVILWLITPVVFWSYQNNMLENTMTVFCLFSTYFTLKSFREQQVINSLLASVFLYGAILSKGIVALFPVSIPFIYFLIFGKKYLLKSAIATSLLILFPMLFFIITFSLFPDSKQFISNYLNVQVVASLKEKTDVTTDNRFSIVLFLLSNLIPALILTIILFIRSRRKNGKLDISKESLLFLLMGFSASLPIMLSVKQREFYLVPSIPYFALFLGLFLIPLIEKKSFSAKISKLINYLSVSIICFSIFFSISKFGHITRNEEKLKDAYDISTYINHGETIAVDETFKTDYLFYAQLARNGNISLVTNKPSNFLLLNKGVKLNKGNFKKTDLELNSFDLYQKTLD